MKKAKHITKNIFYFFYDIQFTNVSNVTLKQTTLHQILSENGEIFSTARSCVNISFIKLRWNVLETHLVWHFRQRFDTLHDISNDRFSSVFQFQIFFLFKMHVKHAWWQCFLSEIDASHERYCGKYYFSPITIT